MAVECAWSGLERVQEDPEQDGEAGDLGPADMNAVTGVGAPSYTSGTHMWNGTAATLKPKLTTSMIMARKMTGIRAGPRPAGTEDARKFRGRP